MWRSLDLYKEGTLPPSGPDGLSPPSHSSSSYPGGYSCNNTLCLHSKQQSPHIYRSDISDQKHPRSDTNHGRLQWTQLFMGSHDVDTRGEVIERFTNKHNLCILNDGTHTYLKPQAQHANKPTSAIDLTISTPGLALRNVWEVLQDTHGSDHYPILTSILPSVAEIQPSCDPSHWVFSKANWEQFHDVCLESISEGILEEADPLHSFVQHITKATNDCIPRVTTIPKKSNPWFDDECREALKARRALDNRVENWEGKPYLLSEGHRQRLSDSSTRRNASHGQNVYQSYQLKLL